MIHRYKDITKHSVVLIWLTRGKNVNLTFWVGKSA